MRSFAFCRRLFSFISIVSRGGFFLPVYKKEDGEWRVGGPCRDWTGKRQNHLVLRRRSKCTKPPRRAELEAGNPVAVCGQTEGQTVSQASSQCYTYCQSCSYYEYPNFTDEETEAQRGEPSCQRHAAMAQGRRDWGGIRKASGVRSGSGMPGSSLIPSARAPAEQARQGALSANCQM